VPNRRSSDSACLERLETAAYYIEERGQGMIIRSKGPRKRFGRSVLFVSKECNSSTWTARKNGMKHMTTIERKL